MAPHRIILGQSASVIPGVGLTRTLPPVLPPNFLSRKNILADIAIDRAGLTLVSAPAGFGKSSLVAEYVASLDFPVIWYTASETDSTADLNAHVLQAIRNIEPSFAPWFTGSEDLSDSAFLAKLFAELNSKSKHYVLVVDNNRSSITEDKKTATKLLDLLPPNVHAIAIHRITPSANDSWLSNIPNFRFFGINELKLNEDEVNKIAEMHGLSNMDVQTKQILESAQGWPAAVNLLASNLSRGVKVKSIKNLKTFTIGPLNLIVSELIRTLDPNDRTMLEKLALCEDFSVEAAEIILGDQFSLARINNLATEGLFLIHTGDPVNKFAINSLALAQLQDQSQLTLAQSKEIHKNLSLHFEAQQDFLKSLKHAKEAGDSTKYRALFRESMRSLIATGRGKELIQMSSLVGDSSTVGILKRQTVQLIGYAADFQYENAQSLMDEMKFAAKDSEMAPFIAKFNAAVSIYIDFAAGRTEDLDQNYDLVRSEDDSPLDLGVADKVSILRVMAAKAIIYDDSNALLALQGEAREIAGSNNSNLVLYLLNAIDASTLLSLGEFKDALLIANNVIAQAARYGYSGIFGPLDAMYVRARCLLEFSQVDESQVLFEQMRNLANSWSQYIWVYIAESFLARDLALSGKSTAALELVRSGRDRAAALTLRNGLVTYCDLTELFIKYVMKDWERVGVLLGRLPNFLLVERIRPIHAQQMGRKYPAFIVSELPCKTAKDQLYKLLAETEANIDKERVALESMKKALEIGARVGARETFLRQDTQLLNLIIKIASEKPTVYLEELATQITNRLKERSENKLGLSAALTKRELEILRHLATGIPISGIALLLHISQNTMKTHLKNIYRKIGAAGREEAVVKAKSLYIL